MVLKEIEYRNAINEITRNAYSKDCLIGIKRWNNLIRKSGLILNSHYLQQI